MIYNFLFVFDQISVIMTDIYYIIIIIIMTKMAVFNVAGFLI